MTELVTERAEPREYDAETFAALVDYLASKENQGSAHFGWSLPERDDR